MTIIEDITRYCEEYSTPLHPILEELIEETERNVPGAHMLSGHLVGQFLKMVSELIRPACIVELGTYTGFSAICLAQGLREDGRLITIDIDERWNEMRHRYWKKCGLEEKILLKTGAALDILAQMDVRPDLAFVDADKGNYYNYIDMLIEKMDSGAWIIVDNVLFKNEVLKADKNEMSSTGRHISAFNHKIKNDERVDILMLPVRDGLTILKIK